MADEQQKCAATISFLFTNHIGGTGFTAYTMGMSSSCRTGVSGVHFGNRNGLDKSFGRGSSYFAEALENKSSSLGAFDTKINPAIHIQKYIEKGPQPMVLENKDVKTVCQVEGGWLIHQSLALNTTDMAKIGTHATAHGIKIKADSCKAQ